MPQKETKSKDQAEAAETIGTIFLLLSGLVLYIDKLVDYFNIQVAHIPYYETLDVFLWTIGNTISPLLIAMGYMLKGKKWALAAPVTAYCIQLTYIFRDVKWVVDDYFWHNTALFVFAFVALAYILKNYATTISILKSKIRFLMNLMVIKSIDKDLIKDTEVYTEEIISPAIDKLSE